MMLVLVLVLSGCIPQSEQIKKLTAVEIREYEGEKLDSVGSFRDNSIIGVQHIDISNYSLVIEGLVDNELSLTYNEVISHDKYSKVVTLHCVEGWSRTILWEGILLKDLFNEAKVKEGANTVIFYAYDGYSSSLPLSYILDNDIMIAYKQNEVTLPPENGFPFQLVAEDKYGIKWVRWITRIELSDDENFRGFWESRGYNNKADYGGPIFE